MFALEDLARLFDLSVREDTAAGGLTVTVRNQNIVLSVGQSLASVGGRLISLPSAPVRDGRTWLVPVDFVPRALAPLLGSRVELRKPSRLLLLGDIRAPHIAGRIEPLGSLARLTLEVAPATPHTVSQDGPRLIVRFDADMLDAVLPVTTAQDLIQGVRLGDAPASLTIDLPGRGSPRSGRRTCPEIAGPGESWSTSSHHRPSPRPSRACRRFPDLPRSRRLSSTSHQSEA